MYEIGLAEFHVRSEEPIITFADYLLYLDRGCGNKKHITPEINR
jgi:hypothetical protein